MINPESDNRSRSLSHAAQREIESWFSKVGEKREAADLKFRANWQETKAYCEAQSAARRGMGVGLREYGSIGRRI